MAIHMEAKILGLNELKLKTALLDKNIREKVKAGLEREGSRIELRAKEIISTIHWTTRGKLVRARYTNTPLTYPKGTSMVGHVDTGKLRDSIQTKATVTGKGKIQVFVGTNNKYAIYVERLPDGGFLFPAYMEKRKDVVDAIKIGLKRAILESEKAKKK